MGDRGSFVILFRPKAITFTNQNTIKKKAKFLIHSFDRPIDDKSINQSKSFIRTKPFFPFYFFLSASITTFLLKKMCFIKEENFSYVLAKLSLSYPKKKDIL